MVSALVNRADRLNRHSCKLVVASRVMGHRARLWPGADLVVRVSRVGSRGLQKSAALSGSEPLLLVDQFRFKLFD